MIFSTPAHVVEVNLTYLAFPVKVRITCPLIDKYMVSQISCKQKMAKQPKVVQKCLKGPKCQNHSGLLKVAQNGLKLWLPPCMKAESRTPQHIYVYCKKTCLPEEEQVHLTHSW